MSGNHDLLLKKYLQLPDRLEAAIAGLDEAGLDWKGQDGWSIRAYVHHTVEGELIWQVNLRAAAGCNGIEFPMGWYFSQEQETWAERWGYDRRPVGPALALFRGSTHNLVEFLRCLPEVWEHTGRVTWPGDTKETVLSVRDIVLIHLRHMDQHTADIQAIVARHTGSAAG
jgi:hypothetical protein